MLLSFACMIRLCMSGEDEDLRGGRHGHDRTQERRIAVCLAVPWDIGLRQRPWRTGRLLRMPSILSFPLALQASSLSEFVASNPELADMVCQVGQVVLLGTLLPALGCILQFDLFGQPAR